MDSGRAPGRARAAGQDDVQAMSAELAHVVAHTYLVYNFFRTWYCLQGENRTISVTFRASRFVDNYKLLSRMT